MIWFFTPYAFDKRMFNAWDQYMNLLTDPDDWACLMDGDIMLLRSDFGHHIQEYINKYPDTGLFTCYSSRSRTLWMMPDQHLFNSGSLAEHKKLSDRLYNNCRLSVKEINDRVTGHLLVIKKSTWSAIRDKVSARCADLKILSVDTAISREILETKMPIRLMQGIYVMHYYRFLEGASYKKHLQ